MSEKLSTMTPVEIDTALAEIYTRLYKVWDKIAREEKLIDSYEEGLAHRAAGARGYNTYTHERLELMKADFADLQAEANLIADETTPYDAEYARRPWSRFFLVTNNGGHIHSSRYCSTCFATTRFGWLPEVSGQTEAEAVANHGAILCTVCFPSAPVEWTRGKVDPNVCEGSGQYLNRDLPHRVGYYSGNWAECPVCHSRETVTSTLKIRKHKKAA